MANSILGAFSPTVLDHAGHPRHVGPLENADGQARLSGSCGDTMEFWLTVSDGRVDKVTFFTDGCGPSLASGSMAACLAEGKAIEEVMDLTQKDILEALGGLPPEVEHCALLAAESLKGACEDYWKRQTKTTKSSPVASGDTCGETDCSASKRKNGESDEEFEDRRKLQSRLCRIRHKVIVLSGKGGVGKSTIAVNLAAALRLSGKRVGLLDIDIHGPSVPTMLGLEGHPIRGNKDGLLPVEAGGLKVMSLGFLLRDQDDAVIWRGPMKMGAIKQLLKDVVWGDLDYLIIDSPPGTGDEPLSACQLIGALDGAVIVTTPQKVAAVDVRKSITFCRQIHVPVLGVVENMSGFACPKCGEIIPMFGAGGGRMIAEDMGVPFLGSIPLDAGVVASGDEGRIYVGGGDGSPLADVMASIIRLLDSRGGIKDSIPPRLATEKE